MAPKEHPSTPPRLAEENARYKDGPFDHIDVPALASFVLCILGLFLFLTWIRSLDGGYFNESEETNSINRIAHILVPPKMAFIAAQVDQGHPLTPAHSSRPKPAAIDPTALARISRSRQAVVAHIETIERAPKPGLMSILSAKGNGAKGSAVMGLGSRLKLSGLGSLSSKLQGLEGLSQFTDAQSLRKDIGGDPKTAGIDKTMKGFDNAKLGALAKIGSLDLDKIERVDKGKRYGSARNAQELHAVISRRQTAIRMLYEERLRTRPDLEGKITLLLVIEEDGTVSQVNVVATETNLNDPELTQQILRVVKRWVFPAFTGGAIELKTPFVLKPQ